MKKDTTVYTCPTCKTILKAVSCCSKAITKQHYCYQCQVKIETASLQDQKK